MVWKCVRGVAPAYLSDLRIPTTVISGRQHLRSAATGTLLVPRTGTATGQRSFAVNVPTTFMSSRVLSRWSEWIRSRRWLPWGRRAGCRRAYRIHFVVTGQQRSNPSVNKSHSAAAAVTNSSAYPFCFIALFFLHLGNYFHHIKHPPSFAFCAVSSFFTVRWLRK